ncbi:NUDIX hydrolase [Sutcliffiella deserti]|uniref:NUDIX hydrolase n=1 Tax=Sutcliffiella deserti TaxID=2875501 RepID=UPI001CC08298|nr:CoA pyrophosphatase [Sutcliffiella deserti]
MNAKDILQNMKNRTPSILGSEKFAKYAVLLPLIQKGEETHILFEVRSRNMRRQPGEICFPGGRVDLSDQTPQAAAIRETTEELGIEVEGITDVAPLDYLVSPFGMIVYSYVGMIQQPEMITPNEAEVEEVFSIPLSFFKENKPAIYTIRTKLEPELDFPFDLIPGGQNYNWQTRAYEETFYQFENKTIWGLTAKILTHFVDLTR